MAWKPYAPHSVTGKLRPRKALRGAFPRPICGATGGKAHGDGDNWSRGALCAALTERTARMRKLLIVATAALAVDRCGSGICRRGYNGDLRTDSGRAFDQCADRQRLPRIAAGLEQFEYDLWFARRRDRLRPARRRDEPGRRRSSPPHSPPRWAGGPCEQRQLCSRGNHGVVNRGRDGCSRSEPDGRFDDRNRSQYRGELGKLESKHLDSRAGELRARRLFGDDHAFRRLSESCVAG